MKIKDSELILEAQRGDMKAFEELLEKYDRSVMNIAYSYRNSEDDAKDIYQEVFMRVFKGLKNFKFNSEFSTWLFRITTNVCITYHRKMKRHNHESLDKNTFNSDEESQKISDTIEGEYFTDSRAICSDLSDTILDSLNELPPQQKLVFTLKHYEGYKIREIAEMLKCSDGTIKRYLFTATNKMREKLKHLV